MSKILGVAAAAVMCAAIVVPSAQAYESDLDPALGGPGAQLPIQEESQYRRSQQEGAIDPALGGYGAQFQTDSYGRPLPNASGN